MKTLYLEYAPDEIVGAYDCALGYLAHFGYSVESGKNQGEACFTKGDVSGAVFADFERRSISIEIAEGRIPRKLVETLGAKADYISIS